MMTHDEIVELLGAYALDAVDDDEREAVTRHLESCATCAAEVRDHRETVALLASGLDEDAPADGWQRLSARLEDTAPALDMDKIVPFAPPRRSSRPRVRGGMAAAAAALVAVAAASITVLGVRVQHLQSRVNALSPATGPSAPTAAVPGARRVTLQSPDGALRVPAVLTPNGDGVIESGNLPALPAGRTYQLWAIVGGAPVSLGLLGDHFDVSSFRAANTKIDALAISVEVATGVTKPSAAPIVTGAV